MPGQHEVAFWPIVMFAAKLVPVICVAVTDPMKQDREQSIARKEMRRARCVLKHLLFDAVKVPDMAKTTDTRTAANKHEEDSWDPVTH